MSALGSRTDSLRSEAARSAAGPRSEIEPRRDPLANPGLRPTHLAIRWTWSRRAASRSLGRRCDGDVEVVLAVTLRSPDGSSDRVEGEASIRLLDAHGTPIEPPAGFGCERTLRGSVLVSERFRHLDLADGSGILLRASLASEPGAASTAWTRLPEELGIAGGCASAARLDFSPSGFAARPACGGSPNAR